MAIFFCPEIETCAKNHNSRLLDEKKYPPLQELQNKFAADVAKAIERIGDKDGLIKRLLAEFPGKKEFAEWELEMVMLAIAVRL